MPLAEGLFVHSQIRNLFRLACFNHAMAKPSNSAVKRLLASAQDSFTTRTPCSGHWLRGGSACRMVRYWQDPDVAIAVPADDRKVDRGLRIRHKPTPGCPRGLDRRAPHPLSVGGPLVPPAKALQSLEYVDIVGDLASFNFAMTAAKLATEG